MAIAKSVVDFSLRAAAFSRLNLADFTKVNDRQYGIILVDENGTERYVRIGAIVAEEREDMTARELMQSEIDAYNVKQAAKEKKAREKAEKAARDKAKREAEAQKEGEE